MLPRLHVVTSDVVLDRSDFVTTARRLIDDLGNALALHVRGRTTQARRLFEIAGDLEPAAGASGALLVVNDRMDVALATGARGVQLSRRSLPLDAARRLAGSGMVLGWSAHDAAEVEGARRAGADFALLGTIWPSASHPGGPTAGITTIRSAAAHGLPLIAIGGVTVERVAAAVASGAYGVAVISAVWETPEPVSAARNLVQELNTTMTNTTAGLSITVNGEPRGIAPGRTVADLLRELGLHPRLIVVEHNRNILDRERFETTPVEAGDVFELVHFVGGG